MTKGNRLGLGFSVLACTAAMLWGGWSGSAQATPLTAVPPGQASRAKLNLASGPGDKYLVVRATSASNAWILGNDSTSFTEKPVVLHWNGAAWSPVPTPAPYADHLAGLASISASDVWAVGNRCPGGCKIATALILHWNGKAWTKMAVPNPAQHQNFLSAVSASSASNAWAVGGSCPLNSQDCAPLILHWNGTSWSHMAAPMAGDDDTLTAVSIASASNAWAVGSYCRPTGCLLPLALHWNGKAWSQVSVPVDNDGNLYDVTASSSTGTWTAGVSCVNGCDTTRTRIMRWNGTAWVKLTSPSPRRGAALFGVSATSVTNAWATGDSSCNGVGCEPSQTLIVHWNGHTWSQVPAPSPAPFSVLNNVAAVSASDAWAVGDKCNSQGVDCTPLILHWNGKAWTTA